jgi:hypothetical protein
MSLVAYPEDEYVGALGRLVYSVSYLEWLVLGDLMQIPDLPVELEIAKLVGGTTGGIARALAKLETIAQINDARVQEWLRRAATHLADVSVLRNSILHARPATIDAKQRLNRWDPARGETFPIELDRIEAVITMIESCIRDLNSVRPL